MKVLFFFAAVAIILLTGCSDFHDAPGVSVWSEGLWLAFWVPFLGGVWFYYLAYRGSKSGSYKQATDRSPGRFVSHKNVPIYKIPKFWFATALQVIAWAIVWYVNSNHWR